MILAKMTSVPPDLQNYLQAPQNWSPSLHDVTKPPPILSPRREGVQVPQIVITATQICFAASALLN